MNFLAALIVYASGYNISAEDTLVMHENYCQNLYWQPDAKNKLRDAGCDIYETGEQIAFVKRGRY